MQVEKMESRISKLFKLVQKTKYGEGMQLNIEETENGVKVSQYKIMDGGNYVFSVERDTLDEAVESMIKIMGS